MPFEAFNNPGPTEIEPWVGGRERRVRLTTIQISLTLPERELPTRIQLSPISFLPNEILIHIFHHGIGEIPHSAHALPFPNTVAGVCRGWRAIALHTPELWMQVFVTFATPMDHLQTYVHRSADFEIDANFCHWPALKCADELDESSETLLKSIVDGLRYHGHRLRSLSLWDVSDTVVCTVMRALSNFDTPRLTTVSVKAYHTAYTHYYQLRNLYLLPFFRGKAPSLTHLEVDHFPIETFRMRDDWPFNVQNLVSLTLRTQECPAFGFFFPTYLIEFPALCALLRSTPCLVSLALYGPIIEPDEDFPARLPSVTLASLESLIIHRREPGMRYHCELLSVLIAPMLKRLEIPWHDDLMVELPHVDRASQYLLDADSQPRFASVKSLYLHDTAVKWMMPTRTLVKAFPNVEEVILGGGDVAKFAATLRGFVRPRAVPCPRPVCADRRVSDRFRGSEADAEGVLIEGAWEKVKRVVLKEPEVARWKGWVRGFCKWLAASGHAGKVCIEIRDGVPREGEFDDRGMRAFRRGLERLKRYARAVVVV